MKINYVKDKKLEILFDKEDMGNDAWRFLCLIRVLKSLGWSNINLTDRDFGYIDSLYDDLVKSGVDFNGKYLHDIGEATKEELSQKAIVKELVAKLNDVVTELQKLQPTLRITYEQDLRRLHEGRP